MKRKKFNIIIIIYIFFFLITFLFISKPNITTAVIFINSLAIITFFVYDYLKYGNLFSPGIIFNVFGWLYSNYYFIQSSIADCSITETEYSLLFMSLFAIFCFNFSYYIVSPLLFKGKRKYLKKKRDYQSKWPLFLFFTSCIFLCGLLTENYVLKNRIGMYNFFHATRASKSLMLSQYSILSFYKDFITLSMILSLYISLKKRWKISWLLFFSSLAMALFNAFISASRAEILFIIMPIIFMFYHFNIIQDKAILVMGLSGIMLFAIWKGVLNALMAGNALNWNVILKSASLDSEFNSWIKVGANILSDPLRKRDWLWGESYFKTIYNLIFPITNVEPLSRWYLKQYEISVLQRGGGRGFPGVLEAYMNFGVMGIFIIYGLYGLLYYILMEKSKRNELFFILRIIFTVSIYKLFRAESYSFWKTMYWFSIIPCTVIFILVFKVVINGRHLNSLKNIYRL